jgi:hypothetical protein
MAVRTSVLLDQCVCSIVPEIMSPADLHRLAARAFSAILGGMGLFELWAAYLGVPGLLAHGCLTLAGASALVWQLDR